MQYPDAIRRLLSTLPFHIHVDGLAKVRLLRLFDALFGPCGMQEVRMGGDVWRVDTMNPNESFFY